LKRTLLASPEARAAKLETWFDKDDLVPGRDWQEQLEDAIATRSTAFAVLSAQAGLLIGSTARFDSP